MRIVVTGSIATDHLLTFQGRFADSLLVEQLDKISVSFLADSLDIRRGGVAANICFGLASLGQRPYLVDAVGRDFDDYRGWLTDHGVDCEHVHVSTDKHTARFICTTDRDLAQMATFYAGAMVEGRDIDLDAVCGRIGDVDLVVIAPSDPERMVAHTQRCRELGIPFVADPSQQLAFMEGEPIRALVDGAAYLFTNEYELHLAAQKTGWTVDEITERVGVRVTTRGKDGAEIVGHDTQPVRISAALTDTVVDPTGVGDAFRAGFLAGIAAGLGHERSAQLGSMLATHVLETTGTQEYSLHHGRFFDRLGAAYGPHAAQEIAAAVAVR
ncbi:carbohydrate kinase family protein [Arsenicicoccus sp. oral taxon 190]|uniref:carbohydrate kinase family protein n=1 Tax=Arsenicicoccus sp. oral taxon 190 TaxID=1658671 RepID=UPI00067A145B|nr:carbohydrate kinase family protein [Arsenicicoccus sp. oral taxon 190]AKT52066.1 ribokinase [Arsenicicoccus sp. oral taxon 190]